MAAEKLVIFRASQEGKNFIPFARDMDVFHVPETLKLWGVLSLERLSNRAGEAVDTILRNVEFLSRISSFHPSYY
jgi:hypothetical protein